MANVKISQLPATASPQGAGLIPIVQDGTTYSTTATDLVALAAGGVTSFNTRAGAVTLADTDVTGALGYTPVSPTTLADYVPEVRTLTINGTTQDLSANRTFTVETGAVTYPFTGSNIAEGDAVVINDDGTVSSVKQAGILPYINNQIKGTNSASTNAIGCQRSLVHPNNPDMVISAWIDTSNTYLNFQVTVNGDTGFYYATNTPQVIATSVQYFSMQFDPFNPNVILLIISQNGTILTQYLHVSPFINQVYALPISLIGPLTVLTYNWSLFDFQFSVQYPGVIVIQYNDSGNIPNIVSAFCLQSVYNQLTFVLGTPQPLSLDAWTGTNTGVLVSDRLEGRDVFLAAFAPTELNPPFANINQVVLYSLNSGWVYGDTVAPSITLGTPYTIVDTITYPSAVLTNAFFISSTQIGYGFTFINGMDVTPSLVVASFTNLAVNSASAAFLYPDAGVNNVISDTNGFLPIPFNKNYILLAGQYTTGEVYARVLKVSGNTITSVSTNLILVGASISPDNITVQISAGKYLAIELLYAENGVINPFLTVHNTANVIYNKVSPIKYVDKIFDSKNLLGISQNTVTTAATVNVLPFGNIDDNQINLSVAATYYLQDDGSLTTNVTPTLFGKALSATLIKTTDYPTL